MQNKKLNSRALRQLAEGLLDQIAQGEEIPEEERRDFVTSLVRQWITYDGNATVFVGDQQVYLVLGRTPLGNPCVVPEPALSGWVKQLTQDWKVSPDDLAEVYDQLNRGQSAEVVNGDGTPLRLWVNPKERSRGVEPLVKENIPPGTKRDYLKIAVGLLEGQFGEGLDPGEMDGLACSVVKQWQQYEGHACVFLDGHRQFQFKLTEHGDGNCDVVASERSIDLQPALAPFGFPPEVLPEVIARINLGQEIEFRDRQGVPSVLWHDPRARRMCVRALEPVPPPAPAKVPPVLCPRCTGVLKPWEAGEWEQTCPLCGYRVSLC